MYFSCPPSSDMYLLIELQTSKSTPDELRTKAWLKLDIFNSNLALISGAWKFEFHPLPIRPNLTTAQLQSHPQYHKAILYMRVVHQRDSHAQSEAVISAANYIDYKHPPLSSTRPSNLVSSASQHGRPYDVPPSTNYLPTRTANNPPPANDGSSGQWSF